MYVYLASVFTKEQRRDVIANVLRYLTDPSHRRKLDEKVTAVASELVDYANKYNKVKLLTTHRLGLQPIVEFRPLHLAPWDAYLMSVWRQLLEAEIIPPLDVIRCAIFRLYTAPKDYRLARLLVDYKCTLCASKRIYDELVRYCLTHDVYPVRYSAVHTAERTSTCEPEVNKLIVNMPLCLEVGPWGANEGVQRCVRELTMKDGYDEHFATVVLDREQCKVYHCDTQDETYKHYMQYWYGMEMDVAQMWSMV